MSTTDPSPDWHGWSVRGMTMRIGPLPGRKSIVLYRCDGATITPLAYFADEDKARACLEVLDALAVAPYHESKDPRRI